MQLKFLGTGTSQGVPVIGCQCRVCTSTDPRDTRLRTSALVTLDNQKKVLLDCGPDFRTQMLQNQETNVDAVLLTHEHNDHVIGLDDLRPVIFAQNKPASIYGLPRVLQQVEERFPYAFAAEKYPGAPTFHLYPVEDDFSLFGTTVEVLPVMHYQLSILGYKFGDLAYITDASHLPETTLSRLAGIEHLIINCLRKENTHLSHYILPEILALQEIIKAKNVYLTHINHEFGLHAVENDLLPDNIQMAYDGQIILF